MAYPIEQKLVIALASSALFDLSDSDAVFRQRGAAAYKEYQRLRLDEPLPIGQAFPFIQRFLHLNQLFIEEQPVEVVLLSKNSAITGQRVFRSIQHYKLGITRAAFLQGKSPYEYIPAFNASLFLSANAGDVNKAVQSGYPAGVVLPGNAPHDDKDLELRVAFDFDGVLGDDESEQIYQQAGLPAFIDHETAHSQRPHNPGPLADLFRKISAIQQLEDLKEKSDIHYQRFLRTAIVTARSSPTHDRVVTTLEQWGVSANEVFFLGGVNKARILEVLKPHLFFDDQKSHLSGTRAVPMVHIPFGVANQRNAKVQEGNNIVRLEGKAPKRDPA